MAATQNYNRSKNPAVNATPIVLTLLVGEKPDAPAAIGGTGTTAQLDARIQADADESGAADVQDLFRLEVVPAIGSMTAKSRVSITVTPILGDGTPGTPVTFSAEHDETMDAWQTAAGRAQQP